MTPDDRRRELTLTVDGLPWVSIMRLNLGNETELYMLAAALQCHIVDLYVAVANVGDKLEDVTRYLAKTRPPDALQPTALAVA